MELYNMWSFVTDFFHLACFQGSSGVVTSVFLLTNIPLYRYVNSYLSTHWLMDICIVSPFGVLSESMPL